MSHFQCELLVVSAKFAADQENLLRAVPPCPRIFQCLGLTYRTHFLANMLTKFCILSFAIYDGFFKALIVLLFVFPLSIETCHTLPHKWSLFSLVTCLDLSQCLTLPLPDPQLSVFIVEGQC